MNTMHKNNKTISRQLKSAFAAWAAGLYIIGTGATAYALPEGGQVAAGQAAITTAGSTMTIAQQTAQAIINWQNFGIGSGESVHINQPNSQAILLNRVIGSNPSEIFGQLTANGQVILVNPNGVFFRPGSSVDVGGLTASTLNIANEDFLKGQLRFAGDSQNPVINAGTITAQNGYVNLLAKEVVNEGIIAAQTGSVNLAAGSGMSLDYNGDGKMTVAVTDGAYQSAVANKKLIQADGGLVVMTASGKDALMDSAVNNSGMIQANTLGEATGQISLTGDNIATTGAISADGGSNGHGGTIKIIANHKTAVDGQLSAQGGQLSGDGGFIETSGDIVSIGDHSSIQANAPQGKAGQWLIDPVNITISDDGLEDYEFGVDISTSFVTNTLGNGTNVTLDTHRHGYDEGMINVNGEINVKSNHNSATLTLKANQAININKNITFTGEKAPNLTLETTEAGSSINNGANINIGNGTLNITTGKNGVLNAGSIGADTVNITANTIKQAKGGTGTPSTIKQLNLRQANESKSIYIGATSSNSTGAESMADASLFAPGGVFSKVENLKFHAGEDQDIHLQDVDFQKANITASQNLHSRRTLNIAGNVSTKGSLLVNTEKFNVADNARLISSGLKLMTRNNSDTDDEVSTIRAGSNAKIISTNNKAFTYYPDNFYLMIVNSPNLTEDDSINYDFLNALEGFSKYEVGNNRDFLAMEGGQLNKSITFKGNNIYLQDGSIQMQGNGTLNLIARDEIGLVNIKLNMGEGNLNMMAGNLNVYDSQVSGTGNLYLNTADTSGIKTIILGSTGGDDYTLYIKPEYFRSGGLFSNLKGRVYIGLLPDGTYTKAPIHLTSGTNINNELYLATQGNIEGFDGSSLNTNSNNLYLISQGGKIDLSKTALYHTPIKQALANDSVKLNNSMNELGSITNVSGPNGVEIYSKGKIYTGREPDSGISASSGTITITSGSSYVELDTYANFLANKVFIFAQDQNNGAFKNYADNPFRLNTKWGIATYDALKDNYGNLTGNFRQYGKTYTWDLEPLMDEKGNGSIHVNRPTVKIVSERVYGSDKQDWLTQAGGYSPNLKTYILNDQGEIDADLTQKYIQADNKFLNKSNTFLLEGVDNKDNYKFGESTNYVNKNIGGTGRNGTAYGSANPNVYRQVTFNKGSDMNYKVQTEFWVTPAPLEVRAKDLNITYNGLNSANTEEDPYGYYDQLIFNGLRNGDEYRISKYDISSVTFNYVKKDGQFNEGPLHAGTYGIRCDNLKVSAGFNTLDNYTITYKDGTLIVKPKEVKVALASSNISKTYDGQASVSQNDFTYTGFVQGESLAAGNVLNFAGTNDLAITQNGQPSDGIDVGSYQVKVGKIGVTANDYTFVADDTSSATLQITPHLVILKANDDSIVKNDTPYVAGSKGFSYLTGFVGKDTAESLGLSTSDLNFGNKAGTTDGADGATLEGKYNIYLDGSWSSKNYKFAYEPGQLIININNPTPPVESLESMQAVQSNTSNNAVTANMPNTTGDMPNATSDSTIAPALPGNLPQSAGETTKLEGLPVFIDNNLIQAKDFDTIFAHEELGTFLIQIRDGQMSISPLNKKAVEVLASADPAIRQQLEESIAEHLKDTQS